MTNTKEITILIVEDNPGDRKLIEHSLKSQYIADNIYTAETGEQALDFLKDCKISESIQKPDIILLDLNMPGMGGLEFLKRMKQCDNIKSIPVIVLTTSDAKRDIDESYKLQAAGYVTKPQRLAEFIKTIKKLGDYWFLTCKLPSKY